MSKNAVIDSDGSSHAFSWLMTHSWCCKCPLEKISQWCGVQS